MEHPLSSNSTDPGQARSEGAPRREGGMNPVVFFGSGLAILVFAIWVIVSTEFANSLIGAALGWTSVTFSWFYYLAVLVYLVFVIVIGLSSAGDLRLGPSDSRPEFNVVTWAAMLFAAGIGIDLLFFCIAEPLTQFLQPPQGQGGTEQAARHALELTFLHWGLSGWGVYTLVGMSLAFFSFRYRLPLAIRSALYPILGRRIYGWIGDVVDIAAVLGTVFGVATSLGIGILQLSSGLNYVFGVPQGVWIQSALALLIVVFSAISAVTGVERGIRRLSEFNMGLAVLLVLFVLFAGDTIFLLNALVMNTGDYLSSFIDLSMTTYAFDPPMDWLNAWTLFFWAWWIAWGPFVGLFLARISRGRTIRQFVAGSLILPLSFMMIWMSIMGNSAIAMVMAGAEQFGQSAIDSPGSSIYIFLENLPLTGITTIVVTILAIVFFVTSGDSGSLVLSNLSSFLTDPNDDGPAWMRIFWAAVIGLLSAALLLANGLTALQSTTVIMGLPFAFVLFAMMVGLYKGLAAERSKKAVVQQGPSGVRRGPPGGLAAQNWTQRLARTMSYPSYDHAKRFLTTVARPAMEEFRQEIGQQGFTAEVLSDPNDDHLELNVDFGDAQDFTYQVRLREQTTPSFAIRAQQSGATYYRTEVHLFEGGQGYDLMGLSREQVLQDIVDQYERHLNFLHTQHETPGQTVMPDEEAVRRET